ncbi:MAG TPA: NAD-dependent epimerase/dehydratase family protein [Kofleriaceae bacterium]|nr:NAD-dependent epimerase/dehydratase family protein [Kofleriaceae bacterium]
MTGVVLVIGGAGFVGCNLVDALVRQGLTVRVLDDLSRAGVDGNLAWLKAIHGARVDVRIGDVRDAQLVRRAVDDVDAVFHLAAQVAVTTSLSDPRHDFDVNVGGTLEVLEALRARARPPFLIYTSTNKVYGCLSDVELLAEPSRWTPRDRELAAHGVDERRCLDFHTPYGCSKGAADQYVLDYARTFGLPAVVFRMSCIYGPHQLGTEDQGWIAHFLRRVLADQPITIYGDGRQVRDVLFIDDLVAAFLAAWRAVERVRGRAFNIGGGPANAVSLREVLEVVGLLTGRAVQAVTAPWRAGDQRYYVSDTRAFGAETGWRPRVRAPDGIAALHGWLAAMRPAPQVGQPHA